MLHKRRPIFEMICVLVIILSAVSTIWLLLPQKTSLVLDGQTIRYTGYVRNEKMNGKGDITFSNGDHYKGNFKNGNFDGQGTFYSQEGWSYSGHFSKGQADGQGKLSLADGQVIQGKFKQGIYQK